MNLRKDIDAAVYLQSRLDYYPDTGKFIWRPTGDDRWDTKYAGTEAGSIGTLGYIQINLDYVLYSAQILAWLYMTGEYPQSEIDHIDMNPSNNRWKNLRLATRGQQNYNKLKQSNNTSGAKNISYDKAREKWAVQVNADGHRRYQKRFDSLNEAIAASEEAVLKFHGEFARIDNADADRNQTPVRRIRVKKQRRSNGPRSQETKDKISKAQKGIERPHTRGHIPESSKSGLYCIGYRADSNKWMVRINDKKYGQFDTVEEAVIRRDEVLALIRLGQEPPEQQMKFSDAPNVQNTSGHRGVTWNKNRNKWFVQYTRDNIKYNIGFFDDKDVGAAAYEKARNTPTDGLPKAQKRDPDSKGISFDKARGKWMARVADKTLGRFTTREDAFEALQTYRMKLHSPDI